MTHEYQKPSLQHVFSKTIWYFYSFFQSKVKCSPFEIHFNRKKTNTIWKQLASNYLSDGNLDKVKSTLSKEWALDWKSDDQFPFEKGYESDYPSPSKPSSSRMSLQSPQN